MTSEDFAQLFTSTAFFKIALPLLVEATVVVDVLATPVDEVRTAFKRVPEWLQVFNVLMLKSQTASIQVCMLRDGRDLSFGNFARFANLEVIELTTHDGYEWVADGLTFQRYDADERSPSVPELLKNVDSLTSEDKTLQISWNNCIKGEPFYDIIDKAGDQMKFGNHLYFAHHEEPWLDDLSLEGLKSKLPEHCTVCMVVEIWVATNCTKFPGKLHTTSLVSQASAAFPNTSQTNTVPVLPYRHKTQLLSRCHRSDGRHNAQLLSRCLGTDGR